MRTLQVRPVRDLRNNYAGIETLLQDHDPVIITKNGRGAAVLLNIDDFAGVEEYLHFKYVSEKLAEAGQPAKPVASEFSQSENSTRTLAASPGAVWTDYKKVLSRLKKKHGGV